MSSEGEGADEDLEEEARDWEWCLRILEFWKDYQFPVLSFCIARQFKAKPAQSSECIRGTVGSGAGAGAGASSRGPEKTGQGRDFRIGVWASTPDRKAPHRNSKLHSPNTPNSKTQKPQPKQKTFVA